MELQTINSNICLIGSWEDNDLWMDELRKEVKNISEKYCVGLNFNFLNTVSPIHAKFLPENLWDNILLDLKLSQELMLIRKSDVLVYVTDGQLSKLRERFLDKISKENIIVILWTPDTVIKEEDKLREEDASGIRPGVIMYHGNIKKLASFLVYICLNNMENVSE